MPLVFILYSAFVHHAQALVYCASLWSTTHLPKLPGKLCDLCSVSNSLACITAIYTQISPGLPLFLSLQYKAIFNAESYQGKLCTLWLVLPLQPLCHP